MLIIRYHCPLAICVYNTATTRPSRGHPAALFSINVTIHKLQIHKYIICVYASGQENNYQKCGQCASDIKLLISGSLCINNRSHFRCVHHLTCFWAMHRLARGLRISVVTFRLSSEKNRHSGKSKIRIYFLSTYSFVLWPLIIEREWQITKRQRKEGTCTGTKQEFFSYKARACARACVWKIWNED